MRRGGRAAARAGERGDQASGNDAEYPSFRPFDAELTPDAGRRNLAALCHADARYAARRAAKNHTPDDEVRGTLQIAVPSDLGRNLLLRVFRAFRQRHPALRLRILFSDHRTDVFKDPVDVAFRYGDNDDASFISLPVAPENRRVLVASPGWIAEHGEPKTLEDLARHNALTYVLRGRAFDRWPLSLDGKVHHVQVSGTIVSDDAEVIRRLAVAGEGIAFKSELDVGDDIREGRLRCCCRSIRATWCR
jgi:DNA-binding transcriptional LysR family regulator